MAGQALLPSCGEPGPGMAAGDRPHGGGGTGLCGAGDRLLCSWAKAMGCSPCQLQDSESQFTRHWSKWSGNRAHDV